MIFLSEAISKLVPNPKYEVEDENYDRITWYDSRPKPTKADIDAKVASMQAEYDAQEYARNRKEEYPSIDELVVALYDEDDKAAIEAKRAEIKAKYPKP
jgi:hypothetical protein